jgi:hypothetical protein
MLEQTLKAIRDYPGEAVVLMIFVIIVLAFIEDIALSIFKRK